MTHRSGSMSARRLRSEEEMVRRRNAEFDREQMWTSVTKYMKKCDVNTAKMNEWTSQEYYDSIAEQHRRAAAAEEDKRLQAERKVRIRALLAADQEKYAREMQELAARKKSNFNDAKAFNVELRLREEEAAKKEAEIRRYHQWREKEPLLRDHVRKQHTRFVRDAWMDQVREKHREMEEREKEEQEEMKKRDQERLEEEQKEREMDERRRQREIDLKKLLMQQIDDLRAKEAAADALKIEEAQAVQKQAELEAVLMQRIMMEKQRVNLEHGCFLNRQYQLKLRRRAQEIQAELAEDQRTLQRLLASEAEEKIQLDERRVRAKREMEQMMKEMREQAEREKEVEKTAQFLFHEEARKMWDKQESRWNAERAARRQLMNDVLVALREQVTAKLTDNLDEQRQLLQERTYILAQVEAANAELKLERAALDKSKVQWRKEMDADVEEKQDRLREQRDVEKMEEREKEEKEKKGKEKIEEELVKMDSRGYQPMNLGRRRIIW